MDTSNIEKRRIMVRIITHQKTGLMMGVSDDLRGLMVPGHSEEEIGKALPAAIRELLEAEGREVLDVFSEANDPLPEGFVAPPSIRVKAEMVPA